MKTTAERIDAIVVTQAHLARAAKGLNTSAFIIRRIEYKLLRCPRTGLPEQLQWVNHYDPATAKFKFGDDGTVFLVAKVGKTEKEFPVDPIFFQGEVWGICKFVRAVVYEYKARMAAHQAKQYTYVLERTFNAEDRYSVRIARKEYEAAIRKEQEMFERRRANAELTVKQATAAQERYEHWRDARSS